MSTGTGLYQRILVPTDGSEGAETAARGAITMAASMDATVVAMHVLSIPDIPGALEADFQSELQRQATERVSRIEDMCDDQGVPVDTTVTSTRDPAHTVIVKYAHEKDIDCIVMGTTGRSGIRRLALGSVAERTVRGAPVPVMTFHADTTFPTVPEQFLVPTDGSDGSAAAVDQAIALAARYDAGLHVLHAVDVQPMAKSETAGLYDSLEELGEDAINDVRERALENGVTRVEASIVSGRPDNAIVEYTKQRDIDAVIMGTHGRTGLRRLWLGSVTERVIRSCRTPVLTVKPEEVREQLSIPDPVVSVD